MDNPTIASLGFIIGIALVFTAHLAMRSSSAPELSPGPRGLPPKGRENYQGAGLGFS